MAIPTYVYVFQEENDLEGPLRVVINLGDAPKCQDGTPLRYVKYQFLEKGKIVIAVSAEPD